MTKLIMKCIATITAICCLLITLPVFAITEDPTSPFVTISSNSGNPGDEITVNVSISDNPGIAYLKLNIHYDSSLQLQKAENKGVLSGTFTTSETTAVKPYVLQWMNASNSSGNGIIASLYFVISDQATPGEKPLTVSVAECYNASLDDVAITSIGGTIIVLEGSCTHVNTTLLGKVEATCCENGYSGDTYCVDCNEKLASGSVIPATGDHVDVDGEWESDGTQHWHTCYYGTHFDVSSHADGMKTCTSLAICSVCGHTYGDYGNHSYTAQTKNEKTLKTSGTCIDKAVYYYTCSVCGACEHNDSHVFYGETDTSNHIGRSEIRNTKEATCCENGYSGDTYCVDCNEKLASGSVIPATGDHVDVDGEWESDGTQHWHTCYYGTRFDIVSHTGDAATCTAKAKCTVCGMEYGDYGTHNLTHHDLVEPTYESDGNIEYWVCDYCGDYFGDAEGQNKIIAEDVVIPKLVISEYQFLDGEVIIEAPDGAVPSGAIFDVQKIVPPPAEVVQKVKDQMGTSSEVFAYYEVSLSGTDGTLIIHLDGEITIKMKVPEEYAGSNCIKILQEDESGKLITMTSWREDNYLCYKTDWLEVYN